MGEYLQGAMLLFAGLQTWIEGICAYHAWGDIIYTWLRLSTRDAMHLQIGIKTIWEALRLRAVRPRIVPIMHRSLEALSFPHREVHVPGFPYHNFEACVCTTVLPAH